MGRMRSDGGLLLLLVLFVNVVLVADCTELLLVLYGGVVCAVIDGVCVVLEVVEAFELGCEGAEPVLVL